MVVKGHSYTKLRVTLFEQAGECDALVQHISKSLSIKMRNILVERVKRDRRVTQFTGESFLLHVRYRIVCGLVGFFAVQFLARLFVFLEKQHS